MEEEEVEEAVQQPHVLIATLHHAQRGGGQAAGVANDQRAAPSGRAHSALRRAVATLAALTGPAAAASFRQTPRHPPTPWPPRCTRLWTRLTLTAGEHGQQLATQPSRGAAQAASVERLVAVQGHVEEVEEVVAGEALVARKHLRGGDQVEQGMREVAAAVAAEACVERMRHQRPTRWPRQHTKQHHTRHTSPTPHYP